MRHGGRVSWPNHAAATQRGQWVCGRGAALLEKRRPGPAGAGGTMSPAGAAFGAHAARPVSTNARLRFLVSVAYALGLATIAPHSGVLAGIGKRTLDPCSAVKISGREGEFAEYVNGVYTIGDGEVVKINGRLNYQKVRAPPRARRTGVRSPPTPRPPPPPPLCVFPSAEVRHPRRRSRVATLPHTGSCLT